MISPMNNIMDSLVRGWLKIPGRTKAHTAREIAEMIEEKWPSGNPITDEYVSDVKTVLEKLEKEGVVKLESEPRYL